MEKQKKTLNGYKDLAPTKIENWLYIDLVLIVTIQRNMQQMVDIWTNEIVKLNMEKNIKKEKLIIINNLENDDQIVTCKQEAPDVVPTYEYLGAIVTNDDTTKE